MSEGTPTPSRGGGGARLAQSRKEREGGQFESRREELALLISGLDRELWKRGLAETAEASGRERRTESEQERKRVKGVAGMMLHELESRLVSFADACARLAEEERTGLAALLRLPDARRQAIVAIMRLPERDRSVLEVVFALSEAERHALAELLRPTAAPLAEQPPIRIIDPSVEESEGD